MKTVKVRVRGTINDDVEVEVEDNADDDEIVDAALSAWNYVEFEDLWVDA